MPRWIAIHTHGRYQGVDAELVVNIRPVDPDDVNQGTILKLRDGREMRVDEAVAVMRRILDRPR